MQGLATQLGGRHAPWGELGPAHRRTWSLLNSGPPFTNIVTNPQLFKILCIVLGSDFALGSLSANDIRPGCPAGPTHVDYPYSILSTFPADTLACQAVFCLDNFTRRNGGTQVELLSHKVRTHPDREKALVTTIEGRAGDVVLYHSLMHHRSGKNDSPERRLALLAQFLAKYVRPMEDQAHGVKDEIKRNADSRLRQLLAMDCPYPILDRPVSSAASY